MKGIFPSTILYVRARVVFTNATLIRPPLFSHVGFPGVASVKNLPASAGDTGDTGLIPGEGNGNLFQYSYLENPMDRGAWWATVQEVAKSWT